MKKNYSKKNLIIATLSIIILSIINIIKLFYNVNTNVFGYISYIFNALAIIIIVIDWLKIQIKQNK